LLQGKSLSLPECFKPPVPPQQSKNTNHTLDFDEVKMPRLLSVNVGLPRDVTWNGKTVRTSVWKSPVSGRRMVRKLDIDGDAQADLAGHGGEQRAVFVYQMDSYHYWQSFLDRSDFTFGQLAALNPTMVVAGHKKPGAPDSPSTIQDTKRYLEDFDRLQKTAASDQALFDQMTELYPHWVANQSWLMFGFPGA
jgi:hypothetical protein